MSDEPLFYRVDVHGRVHSLEGLRDHYSGPFPSACWVIGGGPSLAELPCDRIAASPLPKMGINLSGAGLIRPTFWTSYDPTVRFHRSIYLDGSVTKFLHRRRAMDLVPETSFKVCDCPATVFFPRQAGRGFDNMLDPRAPGILDWADSLVQGIDLLYRLGFRRLYLAGCDLRIIPSPAQIARARDAGVADDEWSGLSDFVTRCEEKGLCREELERLDPARLYHFDETKSLAAAVQTDAHYFRIVQCLRLLRRCLSQVGLELISVTPGSRLNDHFPYRSVEEVLNEIAANVGTPEQESTRGLYTEKAPRWSRPLEPMRDVKPPNWPAEPTAPAQPAAAVAAGPEIIIEEEVWQADRPFREAYEKPQEAG